MKRVLFPLFIVLTSLVLFSCATNSGLDTDGSPYKRMKYNEKAYNKAFEEENYSTCISMLRGRNKDNRDIKDNLDIGMLCYMNEDYKESIRVLDETDALMTEAFTKSISRETGAAMFNENIAEYGGNVYEYLLINSIKALDFLKLGDMENALVELNRGEMKENEYLQKYGELMLNESVSKEDGENLNKSAGSLGLDLTQYKSETPKKPTMKDLYQDSALLRYLTLLLKTADGNRSNVEVDAKVVSTLGSKIDLSEDVKIPSGKGRLDVLALSDFIGQRHEAKFETPRVLPFYLPIDGAAPILFKVKFVWPEYSAQDPVVTAVVAELDNGEKKQTVVIEDFDQALSKDVRLKANKAFTRSMIRSITKKSAALLSATGGMVAAKKIAENGSGPVAISAQATYIALFHGAENVIDLIDKSETADLRQGIYFPRIASGTGFTVEPGTYSVRVTYFKNTEIVRQENFSDIQVKAGKPTLVVSSCLRKK